MARLPEWAVARGPYLLDDAVDAIRKQWRDGRQIVLLVGAGISVQSGFPSLGPLGVHLLTLYSLLEKQVVLPVKRRSHADFPVAPAFSLKKAGWTSPCLFAEVFGENPRDVIADALKHRLNGVAVQRRGEGLAQWSVTDLNEFAQGPLGLAWFNILDLVAENNPQLIEALFDAIGAHVVPGAAHNLLSQFVSWMNVRLVLTTNFDTLIERSLVSEAQEPYVFDVHMEAPPPPAELVRQHLSVVKLHGSHYGIRADRTINVPLDDGHLNTMLGYFDKDALVVVMDYSGSDARFMGMLRALVQRRADCRIIRVDPIATDPRNAFFGLAKAENVNPKKPRVMNLYYPHSRFFLLDVLQKCSGKMPNTHSGYPAIPQTPAPHKIDVTFGNGPDYADSKRLPDPRIQSKIANDLVSVFEGRRLPGGEQGTPYDPVNPYRFAVITGSEGCGVSQLLAQVAESLYKTHQLLWCDLDEASSVGTLVAWLYGFVLSRQPELPNVPLPLDLPEFSALPVPDPDGAGAEGISLDSLARTAGALWNRLKRDRYLVVIDSVSYALMDLHSRPDSDGNSRLSREAKRIVLFLAMLSWCANRDGMDSQCILTIGTHVPGAAGKSKILSGLRDACRAVLYGGGQALRHLPGRATPDRVSELVDMILGTHELGDRGVATEVLERVGMLPATEGLETYTDSDEDIAVHAFSEEVDGELEPIMRRVFVNAGPPGKSTAYRPRPDTQPPLEWTTPEEFYRHCESYRSGPVAWADPENEDQRLITHGQLLTFLTEAALCNRPRSWCQLLALPSVQEFGGGLSNKSQENNPVDVGARVLGALVSIAARCGLLRRQQGAFYYMDGKLRNHLRDRLSGDSFDVSDGTARSLYRKVHQKMLRYYERTYNVSGDITALNYFYWHSWEYLREEQTATDLWMVGLEELARGLLENSRSARGHLNVYDHTFLLLRLDDVIEGQLGGGSPFEERLKKLLSQVRTALADLYEGSEDVQGGMALALLLRASRPPPSSRYWHERQKIYSRGLNLYRSCAAGILAMTPDCKMLRDPHLALTELEGIASCPATEPLLPAEREAVTKWLVDLFPHFSKKEGGRRRLAWLKRNRNPSHTSSVTHQAIMRLVRTVTRLYRFNRDSVTKDLAEHTVDLLSAGKELLASSSDESTRDTKLLWARYHCTSAFCALYLLDQSQYSQQLLTKILYRTSLAKSYALRSGGIVGNAYEAVAGLHEADALIWEGRLLMGSHMWQQAKARQSAALRALAESQRILRRCRLSLAWWKEITILLCGVSVDSVKCSLSHDDVYRSLSLLVSRSEPAAASAEEAEKTQRVLATLEEAVALLVRVSGDLCFLRAVVRNDFWREARLSYHLFRLVFYTRGVLALSSHWCESCANTDDSRRLVSICNQTLRIFRLVSEGDSKVPLLPMRTRAEKLPKGETGKLSQDEARAWHEELNAGIKALWSSTAARLTETRYGDLEKGSGLYEGSINTMVTKTREVYKQFENSDALGWDRSLREAWLSLCSGAAATDNQGHGDF